MTISGLVSFERPNFTTSNGLDYSDVQTLPARGVVVEAVDGAGNPVEATVADADGRYSLAVPAGQDVQIRALARTTEPAGSDADWDVAVTDNTNGRAVYAIQGSLESSGSADSTRDLNAPLGWGGTSYTGTRASAPFAILDGAYQAIQTVVDVDSDAVLPPVEMRWSVNNRPAQGDREQGEIGTSSYQTRFENNVPDRAVFILGDADNDTDEFDTHVIVHEWGHYFEDQMSRSDSIGGPHSLDSLLDARVALGEGFGNALSAIVLGDPVYRDSNGEDQRFGFGFSLERQPTSNPGWFKEFSVQSILYDIADAEADTDDTLSEGFGPIYRAMTDPDYINVDAFTTIFALSDFIKSNTPSISAGVDALLARENINGTGILGTGETNNAGVAESLPLFIDVALGSTVNFCSVDDADPGGTLANRTGKRQYLRFTLPAQQAVTLTMTRTSGPTGSDPDFFVFKGEPGDLIFLSGRSGDTDSEIATGTLDADTYLVDAFSANNTGENSNVAPGDFCYDFTVN